MKTKTSLSILIGVVGLSFGNAATANENVWKCSAENLYDFSYNGGSYANIHLSGYSSGGDYEVSLNATKTVGNGTTGDGTPFTCKLLDAKSESGEPEETKK